MDNNTRHIYDSLVRLAIVIGVMLAAMAISSCTTTRTIEVPVVSERVTHDTIYNIRDAVRVDSFYQRDSIVVGLDGTDRWHIVWRKQEVKTTDTVYISHTDTVPRYCKVTQTVYKAKPLQWWETALMVLGYMVVAAVIAAVAVVIRNVAKYLFRYS